MNDLAPAIAAEETPFDGIPLLNITPEGVPSERLKKASTLRSIFQTYRANDEKSAMRRAEVQDLLDGGTPYNQDELDQAGMSDTTNLNVGGAEQQLERAMAPYLRLINTPEVIMTVSTTFGADEDRPFFNDVIAEELTRTIRESETHAFETGIFVQKFVQEGVSVVYWPDDIDWRYRGSGLGKFYFDHSAKANEAELECPCAVEEYTVTRLWKIIKNRKNAEANGWNYKAVKTAIMKATASQPTYMDWERVQEELKNNDMAFSTVPTIRVINAWVEEFSGKISQYITTEEEQGTESFLYRRREKYSSLREALIIFPYGLGTNGKIYGIRGLGFKIYAFEQQRNRSYSRMIDQGELASSLMVQAQDETDMTSLSIQQYGNMAVLPPEAKMVPYAPPDLQRTVMPVLQEMERLRNERVSGYSSDNVFDGDQRKTAEEIRAAMEQSASLTDSSLMLFYGPYDRLQQQQVRRMSRKTYVVLDPGGKEIIEMQKRIVRRGVPLEALFNLDIGATKAVRAIGAGSAAAKTLSLARIGDLRPRMDDVGQANLDWDLAVDAVGPANAPRYFPRDRVKRTTVDTNIATLENGQLLAGLQIPVLSSDRHLAHAREHLKPLMEAFQAVEENQAPLAETAMKINLLYNHCAEHVDTISGDPAAQEEAGMMRQAMQQIGEVISNGLKEAEAAAEKEVEEGGEETPAGPDPKTVAEFERHKAKMQMEREAFDLKQQMKLEESATKRAIADAEAAARISRTKITPK